MRTTTALLVVTSLVCLAHAAEPRNRFVSEELGLSIEVPVATATESAVYWIATFFLPPSDRFAANISIQRQRFDGSLAAFDELSLNQFKQAGFVVVARKVTDEEIRYEYKGASAGKALHWYVKIVKRGNHVYLAAATCLETHWKEQKTQLIRSVESFVVRK